MEDGKQVVSKRGRQMWLVALGGLLLVPAAVYRSWTWIYRPITHEEAQVAFQRLGTASLDRLEEERSLDLKVVVPNNAAWNRIRQKWGDPGYVIMATSQNPKHHVYCKEGLGLNVLAMIGNQSLELKTSENPPYGYPSDCKPTGVVFRALPGTIVEIHARARGGSLKEAELVVEPNWTVGTKDRIVGIHMREELDLMANILGGVGIIAIALWLSLYRGRIPHRIHR